MKPILFTGEMVRAILEGRKTQTRRIIKLPKWSSQNFDDFGFDEDECLYSIICDNTGCEVDMSPPYVVGDILWVRETWAISGHTTKHYVFRADSDTAAEKWKPSIFMPREACRAFLKVKSVRAERLWQISESDAIQEGVTVTPHILSTLELYRSYQPFADYGLAQCAYMSLFGQINGNNVIYSNPFVWVIEFEVLQEGGGDGFG